MTRIAATLGIDPGKAGGLAVVSKGLLYATNMPEHPTLLADVVSGLTELYDLEAVVEKVHSMPKQGVASTFTFGTGYGVILGVLAALRVPTHHVPPSVWRVAVLGRGATKDAARAKAMDLWPSCSGQFARKKDDGVAEAALIAHWWRSR